MILYGYVAELERALPERVGKLHWRITEEGEATHQATGEVRVHTTPVLLPATLHTLEAHTSAMSAQDSGEDGRKINSWACVKVW